jgi:hypothetical protein
MPGPPQRGGRSDAAIGLEPMASVILTLADQMAFLKSHLPKRKSRFH